MLTKRHYEFDVEDIRSHSWAKEVLPVILEFTKPPISAVDLGGGHGYWLKVLKESGSERVVCVDHPEMKNRCVLAPHEFLGMLMDIRMPDSIKSDMALSVEFAEHVPLKMADSIVDFLTQSAPVIVFSAATPFQPGQNHVNGQWAPFWHKKFRDRGYRMVDAIRPKILFSPNLPYWLKTNLFIYVAENQIQDYPQLAAFQNPWPQDIQLISLASLPKASPLAAYSTRALTGVALSRLLGLPFRILGRVAGKR